MLVSAHGEVYYGYQLGNNDTLIEEARRVGGHKTKKAAVTEALKEYILHHQQVEILKLFGTILKYPEYDYEEQQKKQ